MSSARNARARAREEERAVFLVRCSWKPRLAVVSFHGGSPRSPDRARRPATSRWCRASGQPRVDRGIEVERHARCREPPACAACERGFDPARSARRAERRLAQVPLVVEQAALATPGAARRRRRSGSRAAGSGTRIDHSVGRHQTDEHRPGRPLGLPSGTRCARARCACRSKARSSRNRDRCTTRAARRKPRSATGRDPSARVPERGTAASPAAAPRDARDRRLFLSRALPARLELVLARELDALVARQRPLARSGEERPRLDRRVRHDASLAARRTGPRGAPASATRRRG